MLYISFMSMILPFYTFLTFAIAFTFNGTYPIVDDVHPSEASKDLMVIKVNKLRMNGCYCGSEYMPPVDRVKWDELLYNSALSHAKQMDAYNYFSHFSPSGLDIGERLDRFGYPWQIAGENLGEGQLSFNEVLRDWMESPSHCKMLMNPKVNEMGIAKFDKYWVQHFGKRLPKGTIRTKRKTNP